MKQKVNVLCGIDRTGELEALIGGKKIALLTAASGVNKQGIPTYHVLNGIADLRLIFTPEHGLYSAMQAGRFSDDDGALHEPTGALMYGLTSKGNPRFSELLETVDAAVYDIQDVGARFYTYLSNLTQLMRACRQAGRPLIVLDRPNPIGGCKVEGFTLDESRFSSFIGEYELPIRYGLTVGEYARWVNAEKGIGCDLTVLPCVGWNRSVFYDETDLLWVNPSPNIPSVSCCFNYIGTCLYEATNISEGRGTTRPFDWIGAPFIREEQLCADMNALGLPGVIFRPICFTPVFNKFAGEVCRGAELHVTDREAYEPVRTMLYLFRLIKEYPETTLLRNGMSLRVGQDILFEDYDPEALLKANREPLEKFCEKVQKYKLYS